MLNWTLKLFIKHLHNKFKIVRFQTFKLYYAKFIGVKKMIHLLNDVL